MEVYRRLCRPSRRESPSKPIGWRGRHPWEGGSAGPDVGPSAPFQEEHAFWTRLTPAFDGSFRRACVDAGSDVSSQSWHLAVPHGLCLSLDFPELAFIPSPQPSAPGSRCQLAPTNYCQQVCAHQGYGQGRPWDMKAGFLRSVTWDPRLCHAGFSMKTLLLPPFRD